ncbi:MAG TPA: response regulator, partial [Myxococcaceae bacterium]
MPHSVLLVDDEKNILLTLSQALQLAGYHTELAGTGRLALEVALARPVDAVLLDVQLPDLDGLVVLEQLLQARPGLPVLMMSGHGTIETAVKATRLGARDFLEKPIGRDRLLLALRNALEHQAAVEELESLRADSGRYEMVGQGPAMQRLYHLVQRAAPSEGRVLLTGENGTGKELVARALHRNSRRAS